MNRADPAARQAAQQQLRQTLVEMTGQKANPSGADSCFQCLQAIAAIGLLIIGGMAIGGYFNSTTFGWVVVGLGAGSFLCNLAYGNLKERKIQLLIGFLMAATYVTVGVLGGLNMLSSVQVGWGVVGTVIAAVGSGCFIGCCCAPCIAAHMIQKNPQAMAQLEQMMQ